MPSEGSGTDASGAAEPNQFSAAPSLLGYLAQVEYALLLTLKRLDTDLQFDVSIETLDDIVFEPDGAPAELFQSKHRVDRTASLTDKSADIWKTLHNWIVESPSEASLTIITNALAPDGSALSYLRGGPARSPGEALARLETAARTSESKANKPSYEKFFTLSHEQRLALLTRVTLIDQAPIISDIGAELELAVRKSTTPAHRAHLVERLRGWWHQKVYEHLLRVAAGQVDRILSEDIEERLLDIAQSLRDEDLPIDYYDMPLPTSDEVAEDERVFVHQLRLIALGSARLRQCIYDHNRAFAQRSRWERERLLNVGELKDYEARLRDEWRRFCLPATDDEAEEQDEKAVLAVARRRFLDLDRSELPRIRKHVDAEWVANGSLHILSDRLEIGWHPDWLQRMREVLPDLARAAEDEVA